MIIKSTTKIYQIITEIKKEKKIYNKYIDTVSLLLMAITTNKKIFLIDVVPVKIKK